MLTVTEYKASIQSFLDAMNIFFMCQNGVGLKISMSLSREAEHLLERGGTDEK